MRKSTALKVIGGLTYTSKMPCPSFSIPASACRVGSMLATIGGTICRDCYAMKGRYIFENVQNAQKRRLDLLNYALANDAYRFHYVEAFKTLLSKEQWFRWHDSGDLQSAAHLGLIVEIANATPHVAHWLPTREIAAIRGFKTHGGEIPPNLTVRYSMATIGQKPVYMGLSTSTVHKSIATIPAMSKVCEARKTGGCADCRACWDPAVTNVAYPWH